MKVKAIKAHVYGKARNEGETYEMPDKDVNAMIGLGFIEVPEPEKTAETPAKCKPIKGKTEEPPQVNPPVPEPDKAADPNSPKDLELK